MGLETPEAMWTIPWPHLLLVCPCLGLLLRSSPLVHLPKWPRPVSQSRASPSQSRPNTSLPPLVKSREARHTNLPKSKVHVNSNRPINSLHDSLLSSSLSGKLVAERTLRHLSVRLPLRPPNMTGRMISLPRLLRLKAKVKVKATQESRVRLAECRCSP